MRVLDATLRSMAYIGGGPAFGNVQAPQGVVRNTLLSTVGAYVLGQLQRAGTTFPGHLSSAARAFTRGAFQYAGYRGASSVFDPSGVQRATAGGFPAGVAWLRSQNRQPFVRGQSRYPRRSYGRRYAPRYRRGYRRFNQRVGAGRRRFVRRY